jgi:hypothetical protein
MSKLSKAGRITVKPFAAVPEIPILNFPAIVRGLPSVSNVSAECGIAGNEVSLEEGCLITKTIKYTHQLAHWVNAVRNGDERFIVSALNRPSAFSLSGRSILSRRTLASSLTLISDSLIRATSLFVSSPMSYITIIDVTFIYSGIFSSYITRPLRILRHYAIPRMLGLSHYYGEGGQRSKTECSRFLGRCDPT